MNVRIQQGDSMEIIQVRPNREPDIGFVEPNREMLKENTKTPLSCKDTII